MQTTSTSQLLDRLQSAQNAAARLIFGASLHVHITPLLRSLHWLPVRERIAFRLAVLVYRCLHGMAPAYLSADLLCVSDVGSRQRLCDDLCACRPSHSTCHDRRSCLCCCRTGCLEQSTRGRAVVDIIASVPASAEDRALQMLTRP